MALTDDELAAEREASLLRLADAEAVLREIAERPHPLVRNGEVVTDPETGDVVLDDTLNKKAARDIEGIARSRARLLGTNPPTALRLVVPAGTPPEEIKRLAVEQVLRHQEADDEDDRP